MQGLPALVVPEGSGPLVVYVEYGDFQTVFPTVILLAQSCSRGRVKHRTPIRLW